MSNIMLFTNCLYAKAIGLKWRDGEKHPYEYRPRYGAMRIFEPENDRQREAIAILNAALDDEEFAFIQGVGEAKLYISDGRSVYWLDPEWS